MTEPAREPRSLRDELLLEVAKLALAGSLIFPLLFLVVGLSESIVLDRVSLGCFLLVLLAGAVRLAARQAVLTNPTPSLSWGSAGLRYSTIAQVTGWAIFSFWNIQKLGYQSWDSVFLFLVASGLAAAGAVSLAAEPLLGLTFIAVLWASHVFIFIQAQAWPIAIMSAVYSSYWLFQMQRIKARIENAYNDRASLRKKTTELELANRVAERARKSAEDANQAKSRFLATISHEIRTPLHGVLGMNTLLLDSGLSEEQLEYASTIRSSGDALLTLINEVLDFSRLEAGHQRVVTEDFDLSELLDQIQEIVRPKATEKNLTLNTQIGEVPQQVHGDRAHLRQVLINLLGNALKFTDKGSVNLEVNSVKERSGQLEFRVSDTGIGIPSEAINELFEPFRQVNSDTTRSRGGSGLGLAISRSLTELMGGQLSVESSPGKGSTFTAVIPLSKTDVRAGSKSEQSLKRLKSASEGLNPILIVEDNPTNQKILSRLLEKAGYQCEVVGDGTEAVSAVASERRYSLIFMDCHMPRLDGYEASREIIALLAKECPPIVAVTANASPEDKQKCLDHGMVGFLAKPVRLNQLQQALDEFLS